MHRFVGAPSYPSFRAGHLLVDNQSDRQKCTSKFGRNVLLSPVNYVHNTKTFCIIPDAHSYKSNNKSYMKSAARSYYCQEMQ